MLANVQYAKYNRKALQAHTEFFNIIFPPLQTVSQPQEQGAVASLEGPPFATSNLIKGLGSNSN